MNPKDLKPLYQAKMQPIYEGYRKAILQHIRTRREEHAFEPIDETIVEILARYYADWLYLEDYVSQTPQTLAHNADALNKLVGTIRELWNDLLMTPRARRLLMHQLKEELEKDPRIKEYLDKLMGPNRTE